MALSIVPLVSCFLSTIVVVQLLSRVRLCLIAAILIIVFVCAVHGIEIDDILILFASQAFMAITLDGRDIALKSHIKFLLTAIAILVPLGDGVENMNAEAGTENGPTLTGTQKSKKGKRGKKRKPLGIGSGTPSLIVSDIIIGRGSNGTVVYKGSFQGRPVAVKRVLRDFVTFATREISVLQRYHRHPNVIRYCFHQESPPNFIDIALELCPASLADIIENLQGGGREEWRAIVQKFDKMRAMKQIVSGLSHLHRHGIIHRDIKPRNILVSSSEGEYSMLISDFGLCKRLDVDQSSSTTDGGKAAGTAGWRAPEMLCGGNASLKLDGLLAGDDTTSSQGSQSATINGTSTSSSGTITPTTEPCPSKSVDIFALGCLLFYIIMEGKHPYDPHSHREANVIDDKKDLSLLHSNEAHDLITRMLHPRPSQRPDIQTCLLHPFFWDPEKRLGFLRDVSDRFEIMDKYPKDWRLIRLENDAMNIVGIDWHQRLDQMFTENLRKTRKYNGSSVQDLVRALRNKRNHYQDLPEAVKRKIGPMPDGYSKYFADQFPKLLMHVHEVVKDTKLHDDSMLKVYFEPSES